MNDFFFFNDTATTEIYTLSLHDALPILLKRRGHQMRRLRRGALTRTKSRAAFLVIFLPTRSAARLSVRASVSRKRVARAGRVARRRGPAARADARHALTSDDPRPRAPGESAHQLAE